MDNSVVIGPLRVINCFWPLGMPPSVQSYPFYLCKQVYIVPLIIILVYTAVLRLISVLTVNRLVFLSFLSLITSFRHLCFDPSLPLLSSH